MYQTQAQIEAKKEIFAKEINSFIKLFNQYFGFIPTHKQLGGLFNAVDPNVVMAEYMFSSGKNPFLPKHPERDKLLTMVNNMGALISEFGWITVIKEDEYGHLINVCGHEIKC